MSEETKNPTEFKSEMFLGLSLPVIMVGVVLAFIFSSISKK